VREVVVAGIAALVLAANAAADTELAPLQEPPPAAPLDAAEAPVGVPGTRLSVVVPEGFELSDEYAGLAHDYQSTHAVFTELDQPLAAVDAWLSTPALEARGMRRLHAEDLLVNGDVGTLYHVEQDLESGELYRWIATFGDERGTVLAVVTTPVYMESRMRPDAVRLLESLRREDTQRIDPFEELEFRVDSTAHLLVAPRRTEHLELLARDQLGPLTPGDPRVFVSRHALPGDIELEPFALEHLTQSSQTSTSEPLSQGATHMGGMDAWEIQAEGQDFEQLAPLFIYQVIATDREHFYVIQGFAAYRDRERYLPDFRAVAASFRRTR
jgi:hypothetical protein